MIEYKPFHAKEHLLAKCIVLSLFPYIRSKGWPKKGMITQNNLLAYRKPGVLLTGLPEILRVSNCLHCLHLTPASSFELSLMIMSCKSTD